MGETPLRKQVGIVVFDDVEVLDFCGPFEVFSVTRLDDSRRRETASPFEVRLIAETRDVVVATGGLRVTPDCTLDECPPLDVLVVPGGWGTRRLLDHAPMIDWIRTRGATVPTLTSVCTGALLLGESGLLDGRRATTHWRSLDLMRERFPRVTVEDALHVVEDGHVFTSAGISAGIDMALRVVTMVHGEKIGRETARHMEYPYPDSNQRRI
jgi:transcriptional regulator GlxA family with amidase domain